jgi:microcystin-dependent protein
MADPFIAEVRMIGFTYAPKGWAYCDGQILPIAQNTALFSLVGTMYGGNGMSTFGLPDLRGRVPVHFGQGPGLSLYDQGEIFGDETETLTGGQLPAHEHGATILASGQQGTAPTPTGNYPANPSNINPRFGTQYSTGPSDTGVFNALAPTGGNQSHENRMPSLVVGYVIAMQGVFPPRS